MDQIIMSTLQSYPLSGHDIKELTKGKTNILKYEDCENLTLEQILGEHKACIILLEYPEQEVGHWIVLFQYKDGTYEYFNSFGYPIDYIARGLSRKPILQQKLMGKKVITNTECLQSKNKDISVCGRYCILRLNYRNASLREFNNNLTQNKAYSSDFWVSVCTNNFLNF